MNRFRSAPRRGASWIGVGVAAALLLSASSGSAYVPRSVGDHEEGALLMPLYRGAAVPFELMVAATPNNCEGKMDMLLKWSKSKNEVTVRLRSRGALEQYPDLDRTEGVNFVPNPFFPEPEDIVDGRYQYWIISNGPLITFFYDGQTLDLVGSEYDNIDPTGKIPIQFPTLRLFATPMMQPDANGDLDFEWTFPYDSAHRGDLPEYSHHLVTFPPPNICLANPNRLDLSTLRAYVTDPFPRSEALPFSDYLRGGLLFDLTIEPAEYFTPEAPKTTLAATYSNATVVGGGIPNGWSLDIDAAFMSVAPPIRPWAGAGSCTDYWGGVHTQNINFCALQQ